MIGETEPGNRDGGGDARCRLPLEGIRVADFSRLLPGPWCAQMLGDLGADVIKVEALGFGDPSRHNPPSYRRDSVYFNSVNTNKRCIALDLATPGGREIAERLVARSEVVLESFRKGVAEKLGLGYARARELKPGIIYCALTGFGREGPLAHVPGHDLVVQAMTGVMGPAGRHTRVPDVPGFQAGDYAAAVFACMGVLAALVGRRDDEGCYLDVSMFDSLFSMAEIVLTGAFARRAGGTGFPILEAWGANPRYATYPTADGRAVAVSLLETKLWNEFCTRIGRPELANTDENPTHRHTDHGDRSHAFRQALGDYCGARTLAEHMRIMAEEGVPICPVLSPDEALSLDQVSDRELLTELEHPVEGTIPQIAHPLVRAGLARRHRTPAPGLGEHSEEVLGELGFSESDRRRLRQTGVVK